MFMNYDYVYQHIFWEFHFIVILKILWFKKYSRLDYIVKMCGCSFSSVMFLGPKTFPKYSALPLK